MIISGETTLVTAFYDIGRGSWASDPPYLRRSKEYYFECFERMAWLDNNIIIYVGNKEDANKILNIREKYLDQNGNSLLYKTKVVILPWENLKVDSILILEKQIKLVQKDQHFKEFIDPKNIVNPEYWSSDYILVNYLKPTFVVHAANLLGASEDDLFLWIDFGYFRNPFKNNNIKKFLPSEELNKNGINIWANGFQKEEDVITTINKVPIFILIKTGQVIFRGCHIFANKKCWEILLKAYYTNLVNLLEMGFVDDDQTLLLMSFIQHFKIMEVHLGNPDNWFEILDKKWNKG